MRVSNGMHRLGSNFLRIGSVIVTAEKSFFENPVRGERRKCNLVLRERVECGINIAAGDMRRFESDNSDSGKIYPCVIEPSVHGDHINILWGGIICCSRYCLFYQVNEFLVIVLCAIKGERTMTRNSFT